MTATVDRPKMPAVRCQPWCEYRNGHPDCFCKEDQTCWSPAEYVTLSQERVHHEESGSYPQQLGVMLYKQPDKPATVYLHLHDVQVRHPDTSLDHSLNLTSAEAIQLGEALIREAEKLRGTDAQQAASD
jgi:hypothetical protein